MENVNRVCCLNNGFGYAYYGQGYYYSVGYFALPKTEYAADSRAKNLDNDCAGIRCCP